MQTIYVKVLPATNTKPVRVKATHEGNVESVTLSCSMDSERIEDDYCKAAKELKMRLGWTGKMQGGHHKNGMVFVFTDERLTIH